MATQTVNDKAWKVIRAYEEKIQTNMVDPYSALEVLKHYFEESSKQKSQLEGSHHYCPNCLGKIDGVANLAGGDHTPGEGDVSLCLFCSRVLTWKDDRWFGLSMEAFEDFPSDQKNELVRTIVTFAMSDRPVPTGAQ